ncbi:hypothetical protein [Halococcus saccharolyticus]|uniref:Uncharacterized protein n=1 Tax=Halococcus saccharolyticus DSM 5350 TaxID=1227455 RepID=M0MM82_9EURY|nr:hypothetical protein [Halococcus saccharolyticus]EMA46786.1 hypothetical protein C449_03931 [Halococcus saccharolyticus DSM 5350]
MNANDAAVLLVSLLLCGTMGLSAGSQAGATTAAQPTTETELGEEVSVFMQQRTAAANGSVDSGMWIAAFERAENQSNKQTLVEQRITTLRGRLNQTDERLRTFTPTETNRSVRQSARWERLVADVAALRTAINDAKTAAASAGVNASGLDQLARRAANLSVPSAEADNRSQVDSPDSDRPGDAEGTVASKYG